MTRLYGSSPPTHDDQLRDGHFGELCRIMQAHTGIQLSPSKRTMIEGRLRRRVRAVGFDSLDAYGRAIFEGGGLDDEFDHLVEIVTTNKTDFFREPVHFDFLRMQAVPDLLARRNQGGTFKLWSAACSIGAEAYTSAMVLADLQVAGGLPRFAVLGTDINQAVLDQARRAIYPTAMLEAVPPALRARYLMAAADPARAEMRIVPELRRLVSFARLNLTDAPYPIDRDVDVIFCRNVLIYFSRPLQHAVLSNLTSHLRLGGYLMLGHSESFPHEELPAMRQVAPTVFQRLAPPGGSA